MTRLSSLFSFSRVIPTRITSNASRTLAPVPFRLAAGQQRTYATPSPATIARNTALKDQLKDDLKTTMRNKEKLRLSVVKSLLADVNYAEKSENPPESLLTVVQKALKRRQDSVEEFTKGGRPELAQTEQDEISVISTYLPKQLSAEDIEKLVRQVAESISATTPADLGKLIKEVGNRADPAEAPRKTVSEIAKRILAEKK